MRFKVGDKVLWIWCGLTKVTILRVFEKTNRYKVQTDNSSVFVKELELKKNYEEYRINKLNNIDTQIKKLKEERKKLALDKEVVQK